MQTKICSRPDCSFGGNPQPIASFWPDKNSKKDGRRAECITCLSARNKKWCLANPDNSRNRHWKDQGIHNADGTWFRVHDFNVALAQQNGHCKLCPSTKRLVADHDHETGIFRGILCTKHNTSLAGLGDNVAGLKRALDYLTQH